MAYSPVRRPRDVVKLAPFVVWLAMALALRGPQWLRRMRSQSWPSAPVTIEKSSIDLRYDGNSPRCLLTVSYSYSVNGERYGGVYTLRFDREEQAEAVLRRMQCSPVFARYNPTDPFASTL